MTKEELKEKAKIVIPIDLAKMEGKVYYKFTCSDLEEYTNQAIAEHDKELLSKIKEAMKPYLSPTSIMGENIIYNISKILKQ